MSTPSVRIGNEPFGGYFKPKDRPVDDELARVGPGTPCGEYLRRFWQPILMSERLTDRPLTIRILGEDLVLYRDLSGDLGLVSGAPKYAKMRPRNSWPLRARRGHPLLWAPEPHPLGGADRRRQHLGNRLAQRECGGRPGSAHEARRDRLGLGGLLRPVRRPPLRQSSPGDWDAWVSQARSTATCASTSGPPTMACDCCSTRYARGSAISPKASIRYRCRAAPMHLCRRMPAIPSCAFRAATATIAS